MNTFMYAYLIVKHFQTETYILEVTICDLQLWQK